MLINELFTSIDGEARRAGELATFVRTVGCNLRCKFCFGPDHMGNYPKVTMADGTKKPLNEVEVGDLILTLNEEEKLTCTEVKDVITHDSTEYERLSFPNTSLVVTPEHPFYVSGKWKRAADMKVGDKCIKVSDHEYAEYEIVNEADREILTSYSKALAALYYEKCSGNMGANNGNYREDYPYRNYVILKYMLSKGYCTQYPLKDHEGKLVVHHLDGNRENDSLDNLVIIPKRLHDQVHARGYNFGMASKDDKYVPLLSHTRSYGENRCVQLGNKVKTFINLSCAPYNTFLANDIYVHNCDSKYTWGIEDTNKEMTPQEILEECEQRGITNITFTGGEPLIQKDADELIMLLANNGFDVSIETDGAVDFTARPWFTSLEGIEENEPLAHIWVCADYKCYASGMTDKMLPLDTFAKLRSNDVLKFVVGSREDLELAYEVTSYIRNKGCDCYIYLSPVFGDIEGAEIVDFMQERKMQHKIRVQLQLHKAFWDPSARCK